MNLEMTNLRCSRCGIETPPTFDRCPECRYLLRAEPTIRLRGWILVCGGFLGAGVMTIAMVAVPFLLHEVRVENRFTISDLGDAVVYGTVGAGLLLGVMTVVTGAWAVRYGVLNRKLVNTTTGAMMSFLILAGSVPTHVYRTPFSVPTFGGNYPEEPADPPPSAPRPVEFVPIAAGTFTMGSDEIRLSSGKAHRVTITRPFEIMSCELTEGQWHAVMGGEIAKPSRVNHPKADVSWDDTIRLAAEMSRRDPTCIYRLPTEAEWEYACRAGTTTQYAGDIDQLAWYGSVSDPDSASDFLPHPVGMKRPNAWGLYDMHGNVEEWCLDWYGDYPKAAVSDPAGPSSGTFRVFRGGNSMMPDFYCNSARRDKDMPGDRSWVRGFRLVRTVR